MKVKDHFQDDVVKHSYHCHSVTCLLDSGLEHVSVVHFDTENNSYHARTLDAAARMWIDDGALPLLNVGRIA